MRSGLKGTRFAGTLQIAVGAAIAAVHPGCATSHSPPQVCVGDEECPTGTLCSVAAQGKPRRCLPDCPHGASRCDNGDVCAARFDSSEPRWVCWDGGDLGEGEPCRVFYQCARGLWCREDAASPDYVGTGGPSTCVPLCGTDEDCAARGERCLEQRCIPSCDREDPSACPSGTVCTTHHGCYWAPAAADCSRDGTVECPIGMQCLRADPLLCVPPR